MTNQNSHKAQDLIVRFLTNSCSDQEVETVKSLLKTDIDFKMQYDETKFVWEQSALATIDLQSDWNQIRKQIGFTDKKTSALQFFMRIAAVLIIMLTVSSGLWLYWNVPGYGRWVVFETGSHSDSIVLPDASIVYLNKNSSITFATQFTGEERNVNLSGEGYFEIQPNLERPFKVNINNIVVEVTGTAFRLFENKQNNQVEVNVTKGSVIVYNQSDQIALAKGEQAIASNQKIEKEKTKNANFLSWKTNVLEFNQAPLNEIAEALKNHFSDISDIKILSNSDITVTTRFENLSFQEMTEELELHFEKKFALNNGILVIYN